MSVSSQLMPTKRQITANAAKGPVTARIYFAAVFNVFGTC
jgi:hypothetical protein